MIRPIDEALKGFFGRLLWGGRSIPVVYASPDRAYGEIIRWLAKNNRIKVSTVEEQIRAKKLKIPMPFCSVWTESPDFDAERFSPARIRGFDLDEEAGTAKVMLVPKPVVATLQADFWMKNIHEAKILETQLELQFWDNERSIPVDFSDERHYTPPYDALIHMKVLGQTRFWLRKTGPLSDNSDLETEGKLRGIRRTFSGEVRAQLPHVPYVHKVLRSLTYAFIDETTDTELETLDVQISGGP